MSTLGGRRGMRPKMMMPFDAQPPQPVISAHPIHSLDSLQPQHYHSLASPTRTYLYHPQASGGRYHPCASPIAHLSRGESIVVVASIVRTWFSSPLPSLVSVGIYSGHMESVRNTPCSTPLARSFLAATPLLRSSPRSCTSQHASASSPPQLSARSSPVPSEIHGGPGGSYQYGSTTEERAAKRRPGPSAPRATHNPHDPLKSLAVPRHPPREPDPSYTREPRPAAAAPCSHSAGLTCSSWPPLTPLLPSSSRCNAPASCAIPPGRLRTRRSRRRNAHLRGLMKEPERPWSLPCSHLGLPPLVPSPLSLPLDTTSPQSTSPLPYPAIQEQFRIYKVHLQNGVHL
uniref:Neogenin C-terminal domain-containing protein n=1 Tax=Knipowitschia caucasica TaxID=637954 RepID=A0AAV2LC10_KNICA